MQPFDYEAVDIDVIDQMIKGNQLKYIDSYQACSAEAGLISKNLADLKELPADKLEKVLAHADGWKSNPNYLETAQPPQEMMKDIQRAYTVLVKRDEIEQYEWKINFQLELIAELKKFREELLKNKK